MLLHQLFNQLILPANLLPKHLNNVVFTLEHILQVAGESVETIMRVLLSFFLHNGHSALAARVSSLAPFRLVGHYVHPLYFHAAVDARHKHIRTHRLVLVNVFSNALSFALLKAVTLDKRILAVLIVRLDLCVRQDLLAPQVLVVADEGHRSELLFDISFDVDEFGVVAHHGALTGFLCEFIQTHLVEAIAALLALPRVDQDGLAQGTQQFGFHFVGPSANVPRIH